MTARRAESNCFCVINYGDSEINNVRREVCAQYNIKMCLVIEQR